MATLHRAAGLRTSIQPSARARKIPLHAAFVDRPQGGQFGLARSCVEVDVDGCTDLDEAVNRLFASANPQERSCIRHFAYLLHRLEKCLEHPEAIPRALRLSLAHRQESNPALLAQVVLRLRDTPRRTAEDELAILRGFAEAPAEFSPRGNPGRGRPAKRAKTTLRKPVEAGAAGGGGRGVLCRLGIVPIPAGPWPGFR